MCKLVKKLKKILHLNTDFFFKQFIKLRIDGIDHIEEECKKMEKEMPIPDENLNLKSHGISKLDIKDNNYHK